MAIHSSILAWRIPWTEEPGGLQSMESQSRTWLSDLHTHSVYMPIPIAQSIPPPKMGIILILSYLMPCPCSYDIVSFIPVRTTHTDSETERDHVCPLFLFGPFRLYFWRKPDAGFKQVTLSIMNHIICSISCCFWCYQMLNRQPRIEREVLHPFLCLLQGLVMSFIWEPGVTGGERVKRGQDAWIICRVDDGSSNSCSVWAPLWTKMGNK